MSNPILFVDHATGIGGAENSLLMLLRHLPRHRWQPYLACSPGALQEAASAAGIDTHALNFPRLRRPVRLPPDWFATARQLEQLSRATGAVALCANTVRAAFYTALAARLAGRPFIWYMRDFWLSEDEPRFAFLDALLKRLLLATATAAIVNSHAVRRHLPPSPKVHVVHNGIEVESFDPTLDGHKFRRQLDIPATALLVGMVGRLRPWKGQDRFLRVAQRVRARAPEAHFLIAGGSPLGPDDAYRRQLEQLTTEPDLQQHVTFGGHLVDVRPALAAMDLFVHPGQPEPFGLVNVEAMAMERAVVAFEHGALPEIVEDGVTGLLVAATDEEAMAEAIITLLQDRPRREEMGRLGRQRVQQRFSIERVASEIDSILSSVILETGRA